MNSAGLSNILQGSGFSAELVRSPRRKTLTIQVKQGQVVVRAPLSMPPADIESFVRQKSAWIIRHLQRQVPRPEPRSLKDGDELFYFGKPLRLQIAHGRADRVLPGEHVLVLETKCGNSKGGLGDSDETGIRKRRRLLEQWYTATACDFINQRLPDLARQLNLAPARVKVRYYKARWGSCNHRGELQFNWLLAMAPTAVFEYVIVHELCHLRHFNHSPAFWRLVASVLPGYMEQRRWLQQQSILNWF